VLIYAQDPGGGKFITPVLKALLQAQEIPGPTILVHPLSRLILHKHGISYDLLTNILGPLPVSVSSWEKFLKNTHCRYIFSTTSSPYYDMTNSHLILAAKNLNIATLGIMDHWKGFYRFYNQRNLDFMPDHILCIDEFTCKKFIDLGISSNRIHVVGHPYLEKVSCQKVKNRADGQEIRILLISQPVISNGSFEGIFSKQCGKRRLIDEISDSLKRLQVKCGKCLQATIRFHPKEQNNQALPAGIKIDKHQDLTTSLNEYDIVLGMDSMALVEAQLLGKYCISIGLPELESISDSSIPLAFTAKVKKLADLLPFLDDAVRCVGEMKTHPKRITDTFKLSTERSLNVLIKFVQGELS